MRAKVERRINGYDDSTPNYDNADSDTPELRGDVSITQAQTSPWKFEPLPDEIHTVNGFTRTVCESCKGEGCSSCGNLGYSYNYKRNGDLYIAGKGWQ
jgi:hypothetical protein